MQKSISIFKKQLKDTLKNKAVLLQFVMFPALALIMKNTMKIEGMNEMFFIELFATMYIGMAPLTSMSEIISEEKEKNTLRMLMMSNVKPYEYLVGVGSYVWILCMIGSAVMGIGAGYKEEALAYFMLIMAIGVLVSTLMGAAIGVLSKNQMAATSISVPVMLVFSFMPMLAMFNEKISKVSRFIYSQQVNNLMSKVNHFSMNAENIWVIGINMLIIVAVFGFAYKRSRLA